MFNYIGNLLVKYSTKLSVICGCILFFLLKLIFISISYFAMYSPRIGDDSLVYIWRAQSNPIHDLSNTPAIESLSGYLSKLSVDSIADPNRFEVFRVILRTVGHSDNILHYLLGIIGWSDLSYYSLFWIQELVVLSMMAFGLYVLLREQVHLKGLVLLLPLLGLALLPAQGIHYFIPSTFALSFGFIVWGLVLAERTRPLMLFLAALLAMLCHRIGIVHGFVGGLLVISLFYFERRSIKRSTIEAIAILLALLVYGAIHRHLDIKNAGIESLVSYGFQYFFQNLFGASKYVYQMARTDFVSLLIVLLGAVVLVRNSKYVGKLSMLAAIIFLVSLLTGFHSLEAYPGEAMIRVWVPLFILLFLVVHSQPAIDSSQETERRRSTSAGYIYVACFLGLVGINVNYIVWNIEKRWPNIDRNKIANELGNLPEGSHLLYFDEDISLVGALAANVTQHRSSSISLLKAAPEIAGAWLAENPVSHLIFNFPRELKPPRRWEKSPLKNTPYGFDLKNGGELELRFNTGFERVYIELSSPPERLAVSAGGLRCNLSSLPKTDWYFLDEACENSLTVEKNSLTLTGDIMITGLSFKPPIDNNSWPWGSSVEYVMKSGSLYGIRYKTLKGDFSFNSRISEFTSLSDGSIDNVKLLSDNSGLIIMAVR